jgi:hypothetical protein
MTHPNAKILNLICSNEEIKNSSVYFDEYFYLKAKVDYKLKYEGCYIKRDHILETNVYEKLNPNKEPYVFIHQDVERVFVMDLKYIINKNEKNNIFFSLGK